MNNEKTEMKPKHYLFSEGILFLYAVLLAYCILFFAAPEKALSALRESGRITQNILWPLLFVLAFMVLFDIFIHPGRVIRFVGEQSGLQGVLLAAAAGIISMGPIYAWFPFLKEIRLKGAGSEPVTVFLGSRVVKPVLLPVLVSYFGWVYTLLLTVFMLVGAFSMGRIMKLIEKDQNINLTL